MDSSLSLTEKGQKDRKQTFEAFFQQNKVSLLLAFLGLFLLGVAVLSTVILSSKKGQEKSVEILPAENSQTEEILVHVAGAV